MKFSVMAQGFYPDDIDYGNALPADAVTITDEQYEQFFNALNTTVDKSVVVFMDGGELKLSPIRPDVYYCWDTGASAWVITDDAQRQRTADQISAASLQKSNLLDAATQQIAPLQDAVDLGMATDTEAAQLTRLKKYRVLLNRVDTSNAPDVTWPDKPYK